MSVINIDTFYTSLYSEYFEYVRLYLCGSIVDRYTRSGSLAKVSV